MTPCLLQPSQRILFQGDSITDAGRGYSDDSQLGEGYPAHVARWLSENLGALDLTVLNRGISGNRVYDLEARWSEDCIELQPDWVSIMIGINDTWRRYDSGIESPIDDYEASFRRILERVKNETHARLILMEPYVLPTPPDRLTWREDLDPRIAVTRRLADEYDAILIPLDTLFTEAAQSEAPETWAADGVHPTPEGHALIAVAWLGAVGVLDPEQE